VLPAFPLSFTWDLVMHASSYRGLMQAHGAFLILRNTANQNATSLW